MGKRGNENSQMRKEDYDAAMEGRNAAPSGTFQRASASQLSARKIIRSRRPSATPGATPGATPTAAPSATPSASRSGNVFGSVNFGGGLIGFGRSAQAPATAPAFSMVGKPIAAASPAPAAASSGAQWFGQPQASNRSTNRQSSAATQEDPESEEVKKLAEALVQFIERETKGNSRTIPLRAIDRALTTLNARLNDRERKQNGETSGDIGSSTAAATGTTNSTSTSTSTSLFGSTSAPTKLAPAPTSSTPLFGNNMSTSSNLFGGTPAAKPNFSFGTNGGSTQPAPSESTTSKSAAESQPTFNFNPAPAVPAPAPASFDFSKSSTTSAITEIAVDSSGDPSADSTNENDDDHIEEAEDPDWDTVHRIARAKLRRKTGGKIAELGIGSLKLQRHKSNATSRIVLRKLGSGGILANLSVTGTSFALKKSGPEEKKQRGQITFMSKFDAASQPEVFYLLTRFDLLDETMTKLNELK